MTALQQLSDVLVSVFITNRHWYN